MNQVKINKKNIFNILLFLTIPVLGFLYSFFNFFTNKKRNISLVIISLFFSIILLKNPPIHDIFRYLLRFDTINSISDIGLYTNDYFFDLLTIIFKKIDFPFYIIPPFFVFLTTFLILKSIDKLLNFYNISKLKSLYIIIFSLVLANPIIISLGLRSHLAFAFFLFGLTIYITSKSKKSYIFMFLAILTHSSSALLILAFSTTFFIKPKIKLTMLAATITYTTSTFLLFYLANSTLINTFFSTLTVYTEFNNLSDKSTNGLIYYQLGLLMKFIILISYVFFSKNYSSFDEPKKFLFFFINNLLILTFATSMSEIAFGRYSSYLIFFIITLILIENKNNVIKIILLTFFLYTLIINNLYINRNILLVNESHKALLTPPILHYLYSDNEYRKLLQNTDINGYPISGPGSLK